MAATIDIEPVLPVDYLEAMRFLAGGGRKDIQTGARAESLMQLARSRGPQAVQVWQARRDRRTAAAALIVVNPGRAGMLFYSPLDGPAVESDPLAATIQAASLSALRDGLTFVQAMLDLQADADERILSRAGFDFLAEMIYMSRSLDAPPGEADAAEEAWTWRAHGQFDEKVLGDVIAATYERSLDCPPLAGARRIADVIASHKSGGLFNAQAWWIAFQSDRPAGCILVNDYPNTNSADVVYLGVTPEFRGRGLARVMLRRAARSAYHRGLTGMTLAVDAANAPALRAYDAEGFQTTQRRRAYAMIRPVPR
jgi:ribosomal protein S18 acetylase RimI-like enzyme